MSRKVMQQALDALNSCTKHFEDNDISWNAAVDDGVNTLKAELAKPEPEPDAWIVITQYKRGHPDIFKHFDTASDWAKANGGYPIPLYRRDDVL